MAQLRSTIYLLAEMGRQVGCSRSEAEDALLMDCPEEREFIRTVLDELYATREELHEHGIKPSSRGDRQSEQRSGS